MPLQGVPTNGKAVLNFRPVMAGLGADGVRAHLVGFRCASLNRLSAAAPTHRPTDPLTGHSRSYPRQQRRAVFPTGDVRTYVAGLMSQVRYCWPPAQLQRH